MSAAPELALPARIDGAALAGLRADLLTLAAGDVVLRGDGVERINGLGLQLLASAERTWREAGLSLSIAGASEPLAAALRRLPTALQTTEE